MRYVCDLWFGSSSMHVPYGIFFFECNKFPTQEELGNKIINEFPILQNDFITDKHVSVATPGGRDNKKTVHHVGVRFKIYNKEYSLYYTNIRPIVEEQNNEMNLYT